MTAPYGHRLRRFLDHKPAGRPYELAISHPAILESRTLFAKRVTDAGSARRLLIAGQNNRKIGGKVVKGKWVGKPIYTLTLEERRTCPPTCHHWLTCFGSKMQWPTRIRPAGEVDPVLFSRLAGEVAALALTHGQGFVVRLHVLGDFFSTEYVALWIQLLKRHPGLHAFGYTAWLPGTPIGDAIVVARNAHWDRFAIRTSNAGLSKRGSVSVGSEAQAKKHDAIVCPAQTDRTECCGTCGLCWQTERNIAFLVH